MHRNLRAGSGRGGFTLVELLVVVAVIALLIGILLPALGSARKEAQAIAAANTLRNVAQAVLTYAAENEFFPPSYVYGDPDDPTGYTWRVEDQLDDPRFPSAGYIHWSYSIFGQAEAADDAFSSPAVEDGGAPRTNPGPNPANWEPRQRDLLRNNIRNAAALPEDRQAKRLAFTGNGAIFPRNKFGVLGTQRVQRLVRWSEIRNEAKTILATEFIESPGWETLLGDGDEMKSHRPIDPFMPRSVNVNDYLDEPDRVGGGRSAFRFRYPEPENNELLGYAEARNTPGIFDAGNLSPINAVGRHHPGGNRDDGGTANFVFVDGHIERLNVRDTIDRRLWGDKFYSITGKGTSILPPDSFFDVEN